MILRTGFDNFYLVVAEGSPLLHVTPDLLPHLISDVVFCFILLDDEEERIIVRYVGRRENKSPKSSVELSQYKRIGIAYDFEAKTIVRATRH